MNFIRFFIMCIGLFPTENQSITFFKNLRLSKDKMEEHFTQEQQVSPHSKITVENVIGNITISTWKKNKILIEATKTGTKESLQLSAIDVKYTKEGVTLKTISLKSDKERLCSVDYTIIVPQSAIADVKTNKGTITICQVNTKTTAHATYGSIILKEVENSIQASTKYGPITIQLTAVAPSHQISAQAQRGNIMLQVPQKTNALLCATTEKGRVTSDCLITLEPRTLKISHNSFTHLKRDVRGSLGLGGSAVIKLYTARGNIKIT